MSTIVAMPDRVNRPRRHRRNHLSGLRIFRDRHAVKRRAHLHVHEVRPALVDELSDTLICCCATAMRA
jgi:hypothetical protein